MTKPPPLLTAKEAANILNVHVDTMRAWRRNKAHPLAYIKLGTRIRYRMRDLENFINGKKPKQRREVEEEVSIITQYDMERKGWYDIAYINGKQVWSKESKE
jgi:excisionase family DNA binding protein